MFVNADDVMRLISAFRICWLSGRFGGGKTAGAIWIAGWLVQNGYAKKIVSNIPIKGAKKPDVPLEDAVIILDEAWMYVDNWRDVKKYAAFLRKKNLYLIMPSVWPPNPRLRIIEVQRILNLYVAGLPIWIYRWNLYMGSVKEKGRFGLWRPDRIFGMYDTEFIPTDDGGITRAINQTMKLTISKQGKDTNGERTPFNDDAAGDESGDETARRIEDNLDRFATLAAEQETALKRYRRRG